MTHSLHERFTDRARKIFQLATEEAQRWHNVAIDSQHILLGLVVEGTGVAANVLVNAGLELGRVRREIENQLQPGLPYGVGINIVRSPGAQRIIDYSMQEARELNHNYVGTEHLLLGILREENGIGARVLTGLGLSLDSARQEVRRLLGQPQQGAVILQKPRGTYPGWIVPALIIALIAAIVVIVILAAT